ncbi:MAG: IclR family transcriptional regulator [Bosea sp. (in: a-proteobacteria)]
MTNFSSSSAERCLAILELLVDQPDGLPMSNIAQRLDLPVSATHRLLSVLVQKRYVRQSALTERYIATMLLAAHGLRLLEHSNLTGACQPLLEELAAQCEELVRLAVLENEHLIWVAKAQGARNSIRYDPISGRDVPLHATAMGKAWLATLPEDHAIALVQERGMSGDLVGPNAVRTPEALREHLRLTRERGFAIVEQEAEPGISAVATVVRDLSLPGHPVVGTISIGGPSFRMDRDRLVSFRDALAQTAQRLSEIWPVHIYQSRQVA